MRSQDDSMFQKIDRDQARQNRQEQDEDYFFMNQVYNYNEQVMNQMINQIEQHCLILHILYFDINNESKYFMDDSWDFFFYRRNFKTIPSNKSLSLNIERIFQKYKNQYLYIQSNPFLIYKLMPFNITLTTQDCQECKHIGQCINHQIFLQNQYFALQQNPNAEQNKSQKEIIEKQLAELKLKLSKKEEIQTHTRSILMQINVTQELFQNQYQHDEKISQSIFGYWQNLYQLEAIFNPTRDQSLKMFESSEFPQIGSILQRKPHPIHIIKFSFTDYDRLEIFHKNLKYYSCQIQKILRQVYFMNLIGKDPNNIQSLNTNQPYFNFHVNEDLQNQQISVEIKRNELDFSMAIKNRFDDKSKVLTCQILYRQNDNKINDLFSSFMRLIFRSINNLEIDLIPIENQIRHITNIYSLVQQFFKNPEESFYKQLFQFIKQLDKFYFITDFSKKDMDIINIQEKGYKQPQYIFEVTSQFDFALFKPLRFNVKIYFGKSADNKIFVILEKSPNEVKIESIQTDDLTYYIQEFQKRISFQI